jgi:hypothetical protein
VNKDVNLTKLVEETWKHLSRVPQVELPPVNEPIWHSPPNVLSGRTDRTVADVDRIETSLP